MSKINGVSLKKAKRFDPTLLDHPIRSNVISYSFVTREQFELMTRDITEQLKFFLSLREARQIVETGKAPIRENRELRDSGKYIHDLQLGLWMPSPQFIIFYADGKLADGFHRIYDLVKAGKDVPDNLADDIGIQVTLVTNYPREFTLPNGKKVPSIINVDCGYSRTSSDHLKLAAALGFREVLKHPKNVASYIRTLCEIVVGKNKWYKPSNAQTDQICYDLGLGKHFDWVSDIAATPLSGFKKPRPLAERPVAQVSTILGFYHYLRPKLAEQFMAKINTHVGCYPNDPALTLHQWYLLKETRHNNTGNYRWITPKITANALFHSSQDLPLTVEQLTDPKLYNPAAEWLLRLNDGMVATLKAIALTPYDLRPLKSKI